VGNNGDYYHGVAIESVSVALSCMTHIVARDLGHEILP